MVQVNAENLCILCAARLGRFALCSLGVIGAAIWKSILAPSIGDADSCQVRTRAPHHITTVPHAAGSGLVSSRARPHGFLEIDHGRGAAGTTANDGPVIFGCTSKLYRVTNKLCRVSDIVLIVRD